MDYLRRVMPSLTALEFFDAAVRCMSFTRAATDLNVTQSAVSRQIRALEDYLGQPLFHRVKQRLALTEAGETYAVAVRDLLNKAEATTVQVMAYNGKGGVLTVALLPTFGSRWLVPKLGDFIARYGDIQLNLVTQVKPFDFSGSGIDAAIHFGDGVWPGAVCHRLLGEVIIPVGAPSLVGNPSRLAHPQDVKQYPLLQLSSRPQAWLDWLHAVGVKGSEDVHGPRFEEFHMVIQAAIAGLGLAVLPRFMIQEELASGRLMVAFDRPVTSEQAYYLVHPEGKGDLYKVCVFEDWLIEQCRRADFSEPAPGQEPR
jgi:DNA-binding transcriptional LysR family regulator